MFQRFTLQNDLLMDGAEDLFPSTLSSWQNGRCGLPNTEREKVNL